ncbi:MAG: SAM-dependent methyltransferase [Hyphomicrobiaceae bacterium]
MPPTTAYLAPEGFLEELTAELGPQVGAIHGRLVVADGPPVDPPPAFVANIWHDAEEVAIASIGDAARQLRAVQRNWALYGVEHHRRAALIVEKLPKVSARPLVFGDPAPTAPLGSFTLIAPDRMLFAARCSSPFPNGEARFVEDREGPPSRAYLKLWEALTLIGERPQPGETCLDLGAAPGGWTWVLASLGARVIAVDKAPLDAAVAAMPGVATRSASAFSLDPSREGPVDWLFSDVICYPGRMLALIERWIAAGAARRIVTTVKFQGPTDLGAIAAFHAIPGGRLMHLHHNKHELTFVWRGA